MPKRVDVDEKRAELVAASWTVISKEGLRAATMRRVAESAGCTTGTLVHYFANRKALLVGVLRAAHVQAGARMLPHLEAEGTLREKLHAIALEALPFDAVRVREWRVWLAFWAEAMNDAELALENQRRYDEWRALLEQLLRATHRPDSEVASLADQTVAFIDGLGLRIARIAPSRRRLLAREQAACRLLLEQWLDALDVLEP